LTGTKFPKSADDVALGAAVEMEVLTRVVVDTCVGGGVLEVVWGGVDAEVGCEPGGKKGFCGGGNAGCGWSSTGWFPVVHGVGGPNLLSIETGIGVMEKNGWELICEPS